MTVKSVGEECQVGASSLVTEQIRDVNGCKTQSLRSLKLNQTFLFFVDDIEEMLGKTGFIHWF